MATFEKGDKIIATERLGGFLAGWVDKGTHGVIVDAGWFGYLEARFDNGVKTRVHADEIAHR